LPADSADLYATPSSSSCSSHASAAASIERDGGHTKPFGMFAFVRLFGRRSSTSFFFFLRFFFVSDELLFFGAASTADTPKSSVKISSTRDIAATLPDTLRRWSWRSSKR
jgi:hypothetical protein